MSISLLTILAVITVGELTLTDTLRKQRDTWREMKEMRHAITGDPELRENGERTDYGFAGDCGTTPLVFLGGLGNLITQFTPTQSSFAVNNDSRIATGWKGPYLRNYDDPNVSYTTDAWGNSYVYSWTASLTSFASLGADGAVGGTGDDQDLAIGIATGEIAANVTGYVTQNGMPFDQDFVVRIYDVNWACAHRETDFTHTPGGNGYFFFTPIINGKRSLRIYVPDATSPSVTYGPIVFTVDELQTNIPEELLNLP